MDPGANCDGPFRPHFRVRRGRPPQWAFRASLASILAVFRALAWGKPVTMDRRTYPGGPLTDRRAAGKGAMVVPAR